MPMHNSGQYVRLCVRPPILILFKVHMYLFLKFCYFKFSKVLKQMDQMDYGAVLPPSLMVFLREKRDGSKEVCL